MQLKSLQIQGFKSFPDKTTLLFGRGMTAVVGPNGSGKSNISDAVRWVMGEQSTKNLRGEKMEDVIFLGTQTRKATGFALVALTIDNADGRLPMDAADVTISRKLFRNGDSEYRINKTAVRLKDVHELFMDTGLGRDGYSIIGQGRIEEIVSAKSNQRREIFEEAAGISKYRYRKSEAEKRLELAYENLLRLKDIMAELEARVEPLREQSQKAETFLKLEQEKRMLEISLWVSSIKSSNSLILEQEEKRIIVKNKCGDLQAVLDEFQCKLDEGYEEIQKCAVEADERRRHINEMREELSSCDSDVAVLNNDIAHNEQSAKELREDGVKFTRNREATLQKISENEAAIQQKTLLSQGMLLEKEEMEAGLSALTQQLEQLGGELASQKARRGAFEQSISVQKLNKASSSTLIEETAGRIRTMEAARPSWEENLLKTEEEAAHCKELIENICRHITELENSTAGYKLKAEGKKHSASELIGRQNDIKSQMEKKLQKSRILKDMEKNMEGYFNSVKHVMSQSHKGFLNGIHGPVSQLISTGSDYAIAIETALGSSMQNIVVENEPAAKQAISSLKFAKAGRATFLPINVIKPQSLFLQGVDKMEGYLGVAAELVSCQPQYRDVISNLLGKTVVATDLDSAVAIAQKNGYKFRIVTLDGSLVNAGGSLTGGSTARSAGILSRRDEIEQLDREAKSLQDNFLDLNPQIEELHSELSSLEATVFGMEGQLKTATEDKITYSSEYKRLQISREASVKARDEMLREYDEIQDKLAGLQKSSTSANDLISGIAKELEEVCTAIEDKKTDLDSLTQARMGLSEAIQNKKFDLLTLVKDIETLQTTVEQLGDVHLEQRQQAAIQEDKLRGLTESTAAFREKIEFRLNQKQSLEEKIKENDNLTQAAIQKRNTLERALGELRSEEKDYIAQRERAAAELSRIEDRKTSLQIEFDKVIARLWDEYNLTRTQAEEQAVEIKDENKTKSRLLELKSGIRALGSINVAAIEEYKEVFERYSFMKNQLDDVEASRTELIRLIRELTAQMREIFTESFKKINQNFGEVFEELFMGGKGELILTNPEDVLESGIEISVQPPGKIIKNLSSLSGGEKAFVAIAIYFAILKVRPAPFCMLDEIEAALDEVNVTRYARYLKKLSGNTQFIAITHRRGTMEEADVMYGVTMQEKGVSQLLELDITQVESKLGIS